jgi:ABC-type polysaccharide/polyol phosphate transport system ATPase subunit
MNNVAIRVENLSKLYRIAARQEDYKTLRDQMAQGFKSLFSRNGHGSAHGAERSAHGEHIWALKDVSFEITHGEVVGIIGRNGAGKSTLLKILSRITEPTKGRAEIHGRVGSLLEVGTGFHPELTGRENIYLNGAILGMGKAEIERKFDQIVAFAEVEKFIETPLKHYSSGMYLRLAFSVAAHLEAEILLVDEVLAVGDVVFQKKCLGKMGDVAKGGRTILFVSHNMGAISNLCRRSLCLENGQVADMGETASVISAYIGRISAEIPSDGFADLRFLPRFSFLSDRYAQFDWVRTMDAAGRQKGTFLEQEPIVIEAGFVIRRMAHSIQLGCSLGCLNPTMELFTVPSDEYSGEFPSGAYSARLRIDPNYLREGSYTLALKLFVEGVRQDTILETIQFSLIRYIPDGEDSAYFARWVAGPLRLPYKWQLDMRPRFHPTYVLNAGT